MRRAQCPPPGCTAPTFEEVTLSLHLGTQHVPNSHLRPLWGLVLFCGFWFFFLSFFFGGGVGGWEGQLLFGWFFNFLF